MEHLMGFEQRKRDEIYFGQWTIDAFTHIHPIDKDTIELFSIIIIQDSPTPSLAYSHFFVN